MKKTAIFGAIMTLVLSLSPVNSMAQAVRVAPQVGSANSGLYYLNGKSGAVCRQEPSEYLKEGVVPEKDGKVVFTKTINAAGKTKSDISKSLAGWTSLRYMSGTENGYWSDADYYKNCELSSVKENNTNAGIMVCQGDEEQVFSNRTLAKDYARFQYTLTMNYADGKVDVKISNISYLYVLKEDPERLAAEDYITDKECITKKGGLNRMFGRFRTKTVDLVNELFTEIENAVR